MKSVVKSEGFWTLLKQSVFDNSPFRAKVLIFIFYAQVRYFAGPNGRVDYSPSPAETVGSNPTGGHGCLSFVSVVCCHGYIKKYANSGTRINIVYFRRLLLACVQLPGLTYLLTYSMEQSPS